MRFVAFGLAIAAAASAFAAERFAYTDISLQTTVAEARKRFPNSKVVGDQVYVADQDRRDQVSGIQVAGTRKPPMVRLSFERPRDSAGRGESSKPRNFVQPFPVRAAERALPAK